jgi:WD40 repeat protein
VRFLLEMPRKDSVRSAAFNGGGTRVAVVASDGLVRLLPVPPLTAAGVGYPPAGLELEGHRGIVTSVAFAAASDRLLTGSYDGTVRVWQYDPGASAWTARSLPAGWPPGADTTTGHPKRVLTALWSCDDRYILVSLLGGELQARHTAWRRRDGHRAD